VFAIACRPADTTAQSGGNDQKVWTSPERRASKLPSRWSWRKSLGFRTPALGTALAMMERMKKTKRMTRILRTQWTVLLK